MSGVGHRYAINWPSVKRPFEATGSDNSRRGSQVLPPAPCPVVMWIKVQLSPAFTSSIFKGWLTQGWLLLILIGSKQESSLSLSLSLSLSCCVCVEPYWVDLKVVGCLMPKLQENKGLSFRVGPHLISNLTVQWSKDVHGTLKKI